ncbi:MAG: HD domain-containing protein, partial [Proteobacteria bacterium]|nr:HD domain-containing protein [Pseudomonadota bacterium]
MNSNNTQRLRDPVHGLIVFGNGTDEYQNETDRIAWRLLDTREFQRLRRIRQLGFSDLVYPGATHSRFAHSVGVYHTARNLVEVIRRKREGSHEEGLARVALLAALLHDVGHGPFSHVFEHAASELG